MWKMGHNRKISSLEIRRSLFQFLTCNKFNNGHLLSIFFLSLHSFSLVFQKLLSYSLYKCINDISVCLSDFSNVMQATKLLRILNCLNKSHGPNPDYNEEVKNSLIKFTWGTIYGSLETRVFSMLRTQGKEWL